jgi:Xaa-Pro aminopeptidase
MATITDRFEGRRQKLRQALRGKADGILITNVTNVSWLTGFTGDDSDFLLTRSQAVLISDSRFDAQIADECPDVEMIIRDRQTSLTKAAALAASGAKTPKIAYEASCVSVADFKRLQEHAARIEWVPVDGLTEELRAIKDAQEIEEVRQAVRMAEKGFSVLRATVQGDQTERQVASDLEHAMRRFGAKGGSFPIIVAVGPRAALPHARPTDMRINEADFTLVDWGAEGPGGYCSDLTRVVVTGRISPKLEKVYGVVLRAQQAGIEAVRPGARCCDVDAAARKIIEDAGFGKNFGHGLGHGVGLDIHEAPRRRDGIEATLRPGMIVTIEPGIYLPGWGGVRLEDDVLVTRSGHEVLTSLPKELEDATLR